MRSYAVPLLILTALLAGCLWNGAWLHRQCQDWQAQLTAIDTAAQANAWEDAEAQLEALYGRWQRAGLWLHITMEHDELDEAEALFCRGLVLAEEEDSVEFRAHIADLRSQLLLLDEMEQVRIENVL